MSMYTFFSEYQIHQIKFTHGRMTLVFQEKFCPDCKTLAIKTVLGLCALFAAPFHESNV